jgi:sarcosine oxidase subunit beta
MKNNKYFDAVVIGGGYTGCATAYYLAKGGMDVALIEIRSICSGASGRNGGQVIQLEGREELTRDKIIKRNSIAVESKKLLKDLPEELDSDLEFLEIGFLDVAYSGEEAEIIKKVIEIQHKVKDTEVEFLSAEEIKDIYPIFGENIFGAKIRKSDGSINPFKLAHGYANAGKRNGLKIFTYNKVNSLIATKNKIIGVSTKSGDFYSKYAVVNATNAWSKSIIDDYPIIPCKILGFVTEQLPVIPVPSIEAYLKGVGIYASSQKSGNILIGGAPFRDPKSMDEHLNEQVYFEDFLQYGELFSNCLEKIRDVSIIRGWAGAVGFTPDSYPLVGPTKYENFYMNAGFTNGHCWCPICGKLLAEYILNNGNTSIDIDFMNPERFEGIRFDWPESYNYTTLHNYIADKMKN